MVQALEQPVVNPSYLEFFGLTRQPFARLADPCQLFQSEQYSLLMEHLTNAATNADSLVVLCGADGSGKSSLLNRFVTSIGDHATCVLIDETCHDEEQFYRVFLKRIGFEEIDGTADELRNITKEFLVCRGIAGDHVLVMIDNAHLTNPIILDQLKWLCEIKTKDCRVLSVVLAGNADIVRVVDAPAIRQIEFNSHVVFNIRSLGAEETANYVWHRLGLAEGNAAVKLSDETNSLVYRYSGGNPRLINSLCEDMLAEACSLESHEITEKIVRTVADKLQVLPHIVPLHGKGRRRTDADSEHVQVEPGRSAADPKNLLQQVAKLSEQLDGLRADKTRAIQDIDARNNDIMVLREELDSQTAEVEKLTLSLAVDADEITQQTLALSESVTELQDSENRSKNLASDLAKETRAREAVEHELAKATATVEELSQLQQGEQATVGDVDADLEAGLAEEVEDKTRELNSLRDELDLRNEALADVEKRFEASQAECESAQLRIDALENPQELPEIEKSSDKLVSDLAKEVRAREAAQDELATATATVEELSQLQQELQATVDDAQAEVKASLKVADERSAEIGVLEKNTADLKDKVESKTGELDSLRDELTLRNEILADLEVRFAQSQSACELAQSRLTALKSPKELEELEKASEKLASDLAKEVHAREAAQSELVTATATVEELSQSNQELQATVDDAQAEVKASLKVADEHSATIEVLEKKAADVKEEIEGKAGELNSLQDELASRNETLTGLEVRLEESQAKYESAQQRMAALKNPEELAEIEKASDKLASDLAKEIHARRAAQNELAKAAASVEELSQQKQELQSTVSDLKADRRVADERAVDIETFEKNTADLKVEIEGKAGELDALRGESDKLATDLRKETFAREAAENELATVTATVEELNQLERELQSAVRDLNADLRLAGERAVDAYVLERNVADLKDDVEKTIRELDSKNQTIVDLEKRLEASQNECESLRRRAPAASIDENVLSEEIMTAPDRDDRVYSSHVVAKFEQSIANVSAYQTLREYDPAFYDGLVTTYKNLVGQDLTDKQINDELRTELAELIEELLPRASDDAIIAYARLIVDQLDELQLDGTEPCLTMLIPQPSPEDAASPIYSESTKGRELDTLDIILRTYNADRKLPGKEDVWPDLEPVFIELMEAFGADNVAAMQNSYDPGIDRVLVCNVSRALYSGILNFPKRKAASALRWLCSP